MDNQPLISVVIPTYNRADKVVRAVRSVLDQTYANIEVIVVNDASPDNTLEGLSKIDDPRLKIITHHINLKPSGARNTGIAHAKGEYIAWFDDDDAWDPRKLEIQLAFMQRHNLRMSTTNFIWQFEDGKKAYVEQNSGLGNRDRQLILSFLGTGSTAMVRKDTFDRIGGYDTRLRVKEDLDWQTRFLKEFPGEFDIVPLPLVTYNGGHSSQSQFSAATKFLMKKYGAHGDHKFDYADRILHTFLLWDNARAAFNDRNNHGINNALASAIRCSPMEALRVGSFLAKSTLFRRINTAIYPRTVPQRLGVAISVASLPVIIAQVARWEVKTILGASKVPNFDDSPGLENGDKQLGLMRRGVVGTAALVGPLRGLSRHRPNSGNDLTSLHK